MSDLDRNYASPFGRAASRADAATVDAGLRSYMLKIYNYMAIGLAITGFAALGVYMAAVTGDADAIWHSIVGSLAFAPAVWVFIGLSAALIGWAPRASGLPWVLLGVSFVIGMFGQLLDLPSWIEDVSPLFAGSAFTPFRDAVESTLAGDRNGYQQDPANRVEATREVELDLAEGADMVMVKPGLPYLDVLADIAARSDVPVAAYQVSGEYSMIEAAAANGWIDRDRAVMESLISLRRAGATMVLSYYAAEVAGWLRDRSRSV